MTSNQKVTSENVHLFPKDVQYVHHLVVTGKISELFPEKRAAALKMEREHKEAWKNIAKSVLEKDNTLDYRAFVLQYLEQHATDATHATRMLYHIRIAEAAWEEFNAKVK